jgi:hypothetical protein
MEGKADDLLHLANDLAVAEPARMHKEHQKSCYCLKYWQQSDNAVDSIVSCCQHNDVWDASMRYASVSSWQATAAVHVSAQATAAAATAAGALLLLLLLLKSLLEAFAVQYACCASGPPASIHQ